MNYQEWLACLCLWREGRGSSLQALTGIWYVLQNRVADPRFPNTLAGVILQPYQFSSFNFNDPNSVKFPAPSNLPSPDWTAFLNCQNVVDAPLGADPTDGATNYESLPESAPKPKWADPAKMTVQIGPFRFYRL